MKTAIVTTCWLDDPIFLARTIKWIKYYNSICEAQIVLLDNKSSQESKDLLSKNCEDITYRMDSFQQHLSRGSHLEYPYLWRAVHYFNELFDYYDKIVYMDNDFYILSEQMMQEIEDIESGWVSPFCNKHQFPETGLQVITKDCKEYGDFTNMSQEEFIKKHNGQCMETTLPLTNVLSWYNGDRWSEHGKSKQENNWDFSAQTLLELYPVFGVKK